MISRLRLNGCASISASRRRLRFDTRLLGGSEDGGRRLTIQRAAPSLRALSERAELRLRL